MTGILGLLDMGGGASIMALPASGTMALGNQMPILTGAADIFCWWIGASARWR